MTNEEKEMLTRCPVCFGGNIISDPLHPEDCLCLDCNCAFTATFTEAPVYGDLYGQTEGAECEPEEKPKEDLEYRIEELEFIVEDLSKKVDDLGLEVYLMRRLLRLYLEKGEK